MALILIRVTYVLSLHDDVHQSDSHHTPSSALHILHHILAQRSSLTPREAALAIEALSLKTCAEIAASRGTTRNTIKTDFQRIYRKLGIHSRAELITLLRTYLTSDNSL